MDPSPTLKQFLMLKPKNKGEREKAEEGGQWGDVTGGRDPSFRRPPQPGCPAFIIVKLSPLRDRLVVTECQLTHSHPACPLEFAYYFRPGHLLANACLPVRTTNKISKQFVAPADVRRLLSYCKGRDHGVLDALHVLEGLFRTDPEAKVGSRERQAGNGGTGESHAQVSQAFHFIHPSILPFIILAFHSFLSTFIQHLWRHGMGVRGGRQQDTHSPSENSSSRAAPCSRTFCRDGNAL